MSNETKKPSGKKDMILGIVACVICAVLFFLTCGGGSGSSKSSSSSSKKDGFVGSDGEYHAYVPEFGDDVNNWMEENW